jgi:hypothetical protein
MQKLCRPVVVQYCPYGLTHVRVPIFGNKKGDITSLNQLGILGELFSEFAFALHVVNTNAARAAQDEPQAAPSGRRDPNAAEHQAPRRLS